LEQKNGAVQISPPNETAPVVKMHLVVLYWLVSQDIAQARNLPLNISFFKYTYYLVFESPRK